MNTCQIEQTTKTLKFVPANNSSLKVCDLFCENVLNVAETTIEIWQGRQRFTYIF